MRDFILPLLGLCMFLFGMKLMELMLHRIAGSKLPGILERFTRTPVRGLVTGSILTATLQSSTAVTVITIGLVNAGVLQFPQTLGIILGTNIGSTLTTELLTFQLGRFAMPLLLVSGIACAHRALRPMAITAMGFALVLQGVQHMALLAPALESRGLLPQQAGDSGLLWGLLAGAGLAALAHSSAAAIATAMALAAAGAMPVTVGIAVVLGANMGTCATALLAGFSGGNRAGRFVAISHLVLNAGGALLFLPLTEVLHYTVRAITDDPAAQIAHAQTIFNIVCSLIALPLCYTKLLQREVKA